MNESPVESKRVVRNLPVRLKTPELLEFGQRLAQTSTDIHNEEERQTQVKAELKAKLGSFETERTRLAAIVASGRENRDVSCDMLFDYSRLIVEVVRLDTKEVVETRRMTEAEQQRNLFKEPEGNKPATPEQVDDIAKHLNDETIKVALGEIAKASGLYLTVADVLALTSPDWELLERLARGEDVPTDAPDDAAAPTLGKILDRAHIAGERNGDEQVCTQCGAALDFKAYGLPEGFPETSAVGQTCERNGAPANGVL